MPIHFWHFIHVASALLLAAATFYVIGRGTKDGKRFWLIFTGVLSLLVMIAGFGLWGKIYRMSGEWWIIAKIFLWLGLSAMAGMAYRRPEARGLWVSLTAGLAVAAIGLVYYGRVIVIGE